MVCVYVREDNPRALASGLSPVHTHNHTITFSLHQHGFFTLRDICCNQLEYNTTYAIDIYMNSVPNFVHKYHHDMVFDGMS